jgi:hypothetical protein
MNTKLPLDGFNEYFPTHMPFAFCLNQLRSLHIHFLNLGNLIVCPEQRCFFIFRHKRLIRIENYK